MVLHLQRVPVELSPAKATPPTEIPATILLVIPTLASRSLDHAISTRTLPIRQLLRLAPLRSPRRVTTTTSLSVMSLTLRRQQSQTAGLSRGGNPPKRSSHLRREPGRTFNLHACSKMKRATPAHNNRQNVVPVRPIRRSTSTLTLAMEVRKWVRHTRRLRHL